MSDKINEAIHDIAVKHGMVLGKDDPILILQTMNEKLLEENRKAQQKMLAQFKEEMENISSQWKDDANRKAEKVLNATLTSSKEAISKLQKESSNELVHTMRKMISDTLVESRNLSQQTLKFSQFALPSFVAILTSFCMIILIQLVVF